MCVVRSEYSGTTDIKEKVCWEVKSEAWSVYTEDLDDHRGMIQQGQQMTLRENAMAELMSVVELTFAIFFFNFRDYIRLQKF